MTPKRRGRLAEGVPRRWVGAVVVICIWVLLLWLVGNSAMKWLARKTP
jgi:type IV secretory pathway TrbD component